VCTFISTNFAKTIGHGEIEVFSSFFENKTSHYCFQRKLIALANKKGYVYVLNDCTMYVLALLRSGVERVQTRYAVAAMLAYVSSFSLLAFSKTLIIKLRVDWGDK
jgi:hypothetical protein